MGMASSTPSWRTRAVFSPSRRRRKAGSSEQAAARALRNENSASWSLSPLRMATAWSMNRGPGAKGACFSHPCTRGRNSSSPGRPNSRSCTSPRSSSGSISEGAVSTRILPVPFNWDRASLRARTNRGSAIRGWTSWRTRTLFPSWARCAATASTAVIPLTVPCFERRPENAVHHWSRSSGNRCLSRRVSRSSSVLITARTVWPRVIIFFNS